MALNPTDAPIYDNSGGYVPGQVDSTNGGYDPYAPQNYTGAYAPSYAGGYNGDQALSSGGGYNPSSPSAYLTGTDSIGGQAAITDGASIAPNYNAVQSGGYDPANPNADTYTGGGADPAGTASSFDTATARQSLLPNNASAVAIKNDPSVSIQNANAGSGGATDDDWRVRISLADGAKIFYKTAGADANKLMAPLNDTNGVIFPYTPSIQISHVANYSATTPTHSNYSQQFYTNSEVSDITIGGEFTVQGIDEGKYLLAVIYFFRAATKMFFGSGANAGNPPPIVFLDGYGSHYFPHVPCVITNFTHTMPNEVDYIQIPVTSTTLTEPNIGAVNDSLGPRIAPNFNVPGKQTPVVAATKAVTTSTRVPAVSTISITLKPMYSRRNLHDNFNLDAFAAGKLIQTATTGGFL